MKISDLGSVLEFQSMSSEVNADGGTDFVWKKALPIIRGNIKVASRSTGSRSITSTATRTHVITIPDQVGIDRGMRIVSDGVTYIIAAEPQPDVFHYERYLIIQVYRDQTSETTNTIEAYGRELTLLVPAVVTNDSPAFDRNRNGVTAPTEVVIKGMQTQFEAEEIDGTRIMATDIRFIISGDVVVSSDMTIRDGNQTYKIVRVTSIRPGNVTEQHIVQAR